MKNDNLTDGKIFPTLLKFALPVIFALFLQSLYGAVDLIVVGRFGETVDVSGVSTGSQIMMMVTCCIAGLAMGVTILVGQKIGEGDRKAAGRAIGCSICLFIVMSALLMLILIPGARLIANTMNAPEEAFEQTVSYLRICSFGLVFITAYNLLGGIFRGIGDSKTPLITVSISCVINIVCDILFVKNFKMGASGAALATVLSQGISVLVSLVFIRKMDVPIEISKDYICFNKAIIKKELNLGIPVATQDFLVGISFLVILAVVNRLGLIASAGMGVGEKVCAFIMLIPSAFSQSMTAFVAQNFGAGKTDRCKKGLIYGIITSFAMGLVMFYLAFFHGDMLASVFDSDAGVIAAAHDYLRAYGIDCLLTPVLFCCLGYFNGFGKTKFSMIQGITSAFCIRTPLAIIFGSLANTSLFLIGISTPCSTIVQIIMCLFMFRHMANQNKKAVATQK